MGVTLLDRRCTVDIGITGASLHIEGLTVRFQVEAGQNLGRAKIEIVNLNEFHRKQLESAAHSLNSAGQPVGVSVVLSAGYAEGALTALFNGQCREVSSLRQAPDWVTHLSTGDGDVASQCRFSDRALSGTQKIVIFQRMVDSLTKAGVGPGNALQAFAAGNFAQGVDTILHGKAYHGPTLPQIQKMCADAGLEAIIQDGNLLVTPVGAPLQIPAIVLNKDTGLIGSPQAGSRSTDKESKLTVTKARALIVPGLRPKRQVQIQSDLVNGLYQIVKARYTGDMRGTDWYADIECTAIPGAVG